jgi:hypothetical protein
MSKSNSKLQTTLNQWKQIADKELSISEDLRHVKALTQAQNMMSRIQAMMEDSAMMKMPF